MSFDDDADPRMIAEALRDIPMHALKTVVGVSLSWSGWEAVIVLELDVKSRGESLIFSQLQRVKGGGWSEGSSTTMSWGDWAGLGWDDGRCVVLVDRIEPGYRKAIIRAYGETHTAFVTPEGVVFLPLWGAPFRAPANLWPVIEELQ